MEGKLFRLSSIGLCFVLGACGSQQMAAPVVEKTQVPEPEPVTIETGEGDYLSDGVQVQPLEEVGEGVVAQPLDDSPPPVSIESTEIDPEPVSPAVIALLNSASTQSRAGDHDAAAVSLERAVQIEPKNAGIWYRLAVVRFEQGLYQQAANLAERSNSLAGSDRALLSDNWRLIAKARRALGDEPGAQAADVKAEEFLKVAS